MRILLFCHLPKLETRTTTTITTKKVIASLKDVFHYRIVKTIVTLQSRLFTTSLLASLIRCTEGISANVLANIDCSTFLRSSA